MTRHPSPRTPLCALLIGAMALIGSGCGDETDGDGTASPAAQPDTTSPPADGTSSEDAAPPGPTSDVEPATAEQDVVTSDAPTETDPQDVALPRESDADTPPEETAVQWPVGECSDQPAGTGVEVGQIAHDFELMDQYGQMVRLHDFCDKTVLLVGSAFWCPGCIDKAPTLDAIYQAHKDSGLMIITLLTETLDNTPCAQEDLEIWANEYGQTFPVLSDVDGYIHTFTPKKDSGKLPMEILLGPGLEILTVISDVTEADLIAALPGS